MRPGEFGNTLVASNDIVGCPMATVDELSAEIQSLRSELDALRAMVASPPKAIPPEPPGVEPSVERSRRNVLKLAAAGLGGVGLAQMAVSPASAANGANIVIGSVVNQGTLPTGLTVSGNAATYGFGCTDNGANSVPVPSALFGHARGFGGATNFSAAVLGFAQESAFYGVVGDSVRCGVKGTARGSADNGWPGVLGEGNGDGVMGSGRVGVHGHSLQSVAVAAGVSGTTSDATVPALRAAADSGLLALDGAQVAPPSSGSYRRGDVLNDSGGSGVWVCVSAGTPGVWRKVAGAASAGAYHPRAGARAYDSRQTGGKLLSGQTRVVTIPLSVVPARTTAVHYVLTAVSTSGKGSLVAFQTGTSRPAVTSLIWWGRDQRHANALTTEVNNSRQLSVYATSGSTHFTIDVIGYYL